MKIVIDARLYGLEHAGLGRYVMNLIQKLIKLDKKNKYVFLLREKYFDQLKLPDNWEKILADYRHYSFQEQLKLGAIIKKTNCDLVHFPHFNVPVFYSRPYVVTIHDLLMHRQKSKQATTLPPLAYLIKRSGYKLVFRRAVTRAKQIIVPSRVVKKDVIDYYGLDSKKIKVIYEGVNKRVFQRHSQAIKKKYQLKSDYFVYTGNAYPHKNLNRAIEAIVELNQKRKRETEFLIVCSRNFFLKRLEKEIKCLKADKYVRLLGFVPDEDLASLYHQAVGFLYPSLHEGFGLPGLEAMAAETLVLASEIPVFKEVYQEAAIYFNPFDFSSMVRAMEQVLDFSPNQRKDLLRKGQKLIENYSWAKMAEQTLKVYNEAL